MKPPAFDYYDPRTMKDALDLLAEHGEDAKILAGGQSLVPMLNFRLARPGVLVDINRLAELEYLRETDDGLAIGALARQRTLERWARGRAPLLAEALAHVGHEAVRNRGTVAGSIAHADPAAELPALLLCLGGSVLARSRHGEREIPASELFVFALTTALRPEELITEVRLPWLPRGAGWGFFEVARRHGDFALVGVVAVVALANDRVEAARVALFGCGGTPVAAVAVERAMLGERPTPERIAAATRAAADALVPEADLHASAEYRKRVAGTLMTRALAKATQRAREGAR